MPAIIALNPRTRNSVSGGPSLSFLSSSRRRPAKLTLKSSVFIVFILLGLSLSIEAQTIPVQPRITAPVDEAGLTRLSGNTHPLARPEFDQGNVDPSMAMRVTMNFKMTVAQQAELDALLAAQQRRCL